MPLALSGGCLELWGTVPGWAGVREAPDQARLAWRQEAACRDLPTELFFPIGHGPRAQAQTHLAKEICGACAVRGECLDYALATNARYGVFGGLSEDERRDVRRGGGAFAMANAVLEESA